MITASMEVIPVRIARALPNVQVSLVQLRGLTPESKLQRAPPRASDQLPRHGRTSET